MVGASEEVGVEWLVADMDRVYYVVYCILQM